MPIDRFDGGGAPEQTNPSGKHHHLEPQFLLKLHRIGYWLYVHRLLVMSRFIDILIRIIYSANIPSQAKIGSNVHFGHNGLSTIINPASRIGDNCFIGSHVIIGGNARGPGMPTIEDNVVVHAGSMLLGPITIGRGSVIAVKSLVNKSVSPGSLAMGCPAIVTKTNINPADFL